MIRVAFCIGGYPPEEFKRRADVALSYSTSEIQVGIINVEASPYFYGMTPTEIQLVPPAFIDAYRRAEREGYNAVVPLGMLDLAVDGGKSAVDIPVVGPMEASLHIASLPELFAGAEIGEFESLNDDPASGLNVTEGTLSVSNRPGLGVDIDMSKLQETTALWQGK